MLFYKINDKVKKQMREELAQRRAKALAEANGEEIESAKSDAEPTQNTENTEEGFEETESQEEDKKE